MKVKITREIEMPVRGIRGFPDGLQPDIGINWYGGGKGTGIFSNYRDNLSTGWLIQPEVLYFDECVSNVGVFQYYQFAGTNNVIEIRKSSESSGIVNYSIGQIDDELNYTPLTDSTSTGSKEALSTPMIIFYNDSNVRGPIVSYNVGNTFDVDYLLSPTANNSSRFMWDNVTQSFEYNENFWKGALPIEPTPIPPNTPEGNEGNYDNTSDEIPQPELPSIQPLNNNMIHAYSLDNAQISQLGGYLWSTDFFDNFLKVFDNPIDAIIALYQVRYAPEIGQSQEIKIGNCNSGINAPVITSSYTILDCGTIQVNEYFGNALDYSPFTKLSIYLPYIGVRNLDTDICMSSSITVRYLIDCISGTGICYIYVQKDNLGTTLRAPMYTFPCVCNIQIPLTAYNMTNLYSSVLGSISSIIGGAITGGAAGAVSGVMGVASAVLGAKNNVEKSGNVSGVSGLLGMQTPFLIVERPVNAYAKNYQDYYGLPCNMTYVLSRLKGFTKVSKIILEGFENATENEKEMIISQLKEGVIL